MAGIRGSESTRLLTLGTAFDVTTVFEDINYFIIPAGQTVNVLGDVQIKAVGIIIEEGATLNGNGATNIGGYAGGERRSTWQESTQGNGDGPGFGRGGHSYAGGSGAGHGKLVCAFQTTLGLVLIHFMHFI